jgi:aminomethyltransferase
MTQTLAETPLHGWHAAHGGRMVEFGGWSMPVQYDSILEEHRATRRAVGLFDISHMGRLRVAGAAAAEFLDSVLTRCVLDMPLGSIRYGLLANQHGGTIDDVLISHLEDEEGLFYMVVCNAANREKVVLWLESHLADHPDVQFRDETWAWAMLAVQGPRALETVASLLDFDPAGMKYYTGRCGRIGNTAGQLSRTGYTGEDGCELIVPSAAVADVWDQLVVVSSRLGGTTVGLAARDTLRLEAAMPLYGHELSEDISALQAGLGFAVNLQDRSFVGRDALGELAKDESLPRRVGLMCTGKRVPREGYAIANSGERVGEVTSGTFSPTLGKPIGMGYVLPSAAVVGTNLTIDIRGRAEAAQVVSLPFYRRSVP